MVGQSPLIQQLMLIIGSGPVVRITPDVGSDTPCLRGARTDYVKEVEIGLEAAVELYPRFVTPL